MTSMMQITYIGGPTVLIEYDGLRLLTDPTFDPAGTSYPTAVYTLRKTGGPAISHSKLGKIDVVLLSHDHHFDNLDHAGGALLAGVDRVLTTAAGAARLGGSADGMEPWQKREIATASGKVLRITATPARHGPEQGDRGPVIGFVLTPAEEPSRGIYVSGDTVWYDGVQEVSRRFPVSTVLLFMGAARVAAVGPDALTFTASDGVAAARAFAAATIMPVHYEGWEHFSESRAEIVRVFEQAGLSERLCWLNPGEAKQVSF